MRITWRDGVTTLTTASAVVLQYAYYHSWDWPLVSSTRWVVTGLGVLLGIGLVSSYAFDSARSAVWSWATGLIAVGGALLVALGLGFADSAYVAWLLAANITLWLISLVHHLTVAPSLVGHHV